MEIGFAHVLHQKIFLYNPVPDISFYKTEVEAVKPVIINGDLTKIKNDVVPPGKYQHYKGNFYEVLGEGRNSETLEEVVIYRGLYDSAEFGKNPCWVRPKKMFFEKVLLEGKEVPRFKKVETN